MAYEHLSQRLTVEEQQRMINLAALLQANHDQTMGVDELAEIAKSYGIRPEFIHQAAQLENKHRNRERTADVAATWAMGGLAVLNVAILIMPTIRDIFTHSPLVVFPLILAAAAAFRRGRTWGLAWVAPLSIFVTVAISHMLHVGLLGYTYPFQRALSLIRFELVIAFFVAALSLVLGSVSAFQKRREREKQQYRASLRA